MGRRVARTFAARGVPVAGLDVRLPEGVEEGVRDGDGVTWWRCDVASRGEVGKVRDRIVREVSECLPWLAGLLELELGHGFRAWWRGVVARA